VPTRAISYHRRRLRCIAGWRRKLRRRGGIQGQLAALKKATISVTGCPRDRLGQSQRRGELADHRSASVDFLTVNVGTTAAARTLTVKNGGMTATSALKAAVSTWVQIVGKTCDGAARRRTAPARSR